MIVPVDLLPGKWDKTTGVYFLGAALGGDLLQIWPASNLVIIRLNNPNKIHLGKKRPDIQSKIAERAKYLLDFVENNSVAID